MEDFNRPRIVYREIGLEMDACLIKAGWMICNKCYMISGEHLEHLLNFFNTRLFNHIILSFTNFTGGKGVDFMENIHTPLPIECDLTECDAQMSEDRLYEFYKLTGDEIDCIKNML